MSSDIWLGAVTSLAGAGLGGAISFLLNRQQIRDARSQRIEDDLRKQGRRSIDRRFSAYSDFFTRARAYRNALRPFEGAPAPAVSVTDLDALAQSADSASSLVFITLESEMAHEASRAVVMAINRAQEVLHGSSTQINAQEFKNLISDMAQALREFQVAVRSELGVDGVEPALILSRDRPVKRITLP